MPDRETKVRIGTPIIDTEKNLVIALLMSDLAEFLAAEMPEEMEGDFDFMEDEGATHWAIANYPPEARDKIASWAFRRLWLIEQEKKRLTQSALEETRRIEKWLDDAIRPLASDEAFFKGALTEYLRHIRTERKEDPENPKTKSYKLPTGTIEGRRPPERIEVLDETKFIDWALANGHKELVRIKREVDKTAIKKATVAKDGVSVIIEGERVPFVEAKRGDERFDAKPAAVEVAR